jgi:hypothetical protein
VSVVVVIGGSPFDVNVFHMGEDGPSLARLQEGM